MLTAIGTITNNKLGGRLLHHLFANLADDAEDQVAGLAARLLLLRHRARPPTKHRERARKGRKRKPVSNTANCLSRLQHHNDLIYRERLRQHYVIYI